MATGDVGEAKLIADLREIVDAVRRDHRAREKAANAPMPMLRAAAVLASRPGLESSMLAEEMRLNRSTVSNLLRDMEERGFVRRRRLQSDRRFVSLELTQRGRTLLGKSGSSVHGLLARAIGQLALDEQLRLGLAINPLVTAIRNDRVPAAQVRNKTTSGAA